jgi:hypothetical protein
LATGIYSLLFHLYGLPSKSLGTIQNLIQLYLLLTSICREKCSIFDRNILPVRMCLAVSNRNLFLKEWYKQVRLFSSPNKEFKRQLQSFHLPSQNQTTSIFLNHHLDLRHKMAPGRRIQKYLLHHQSFFYVSITKGYPSCILLDGNQGHY